VLTDFIGPRDSSVTRRIKGHNPKSPEDDANSSDLYIRLSTQRKLRKVRNTVYEDPGNPFDFDAFDVSYSPSTSQETLTNAHTINYDQPHHWAGNESQPSHGPESRTIHSTLSNPFDLANLQNPNTCNSQRDTIRTSSRYPRRSMSVDIGFIPTTRCSMERDELPDSDQRRTGDIPLLHTRHHPSGTIFTAESKRDSRFYDFYDDLLAEYGVGKDTDVDCGWVDYRLMMMTV